MAVKSESCFKKKGSVNVIVDNYWTNRTCFQLSSSLFVWSVFVPYSPRRPLPFTSFCFSKNNSLSVSQCWEDKIPYICQLFLNDVCLDFSCCYLLLTAGMCNRGGWGCRTGAARHDSTTTATSLLPPSVLCFLFQLTSTVSVLSLHLLSRASCVRPQLLYQPRKCIPLCVCYHIFELCGHMMDHLEY